MKSVKLFIVMTIILLLGTLLFYGFNNGNKASVKKQHKRVEENVPQYDTTWNSLAKHKTPEWYKDAVLGIYFHWGIYSVPGFGCWGGRNMYQPNGGTSEAWGHIDRNKYANTYDYVKKVYGEPGTKFGYMNFIPMFKAEKWDPDRWAELFKEAGADFAGPVAVHHDGFAMWDSDVSEYNAMDMGPHRDIVGEMLKAVRKHGMKTFASFHYYTNWFFFNPGRMLCPYNTDVNNPEYAGLYGPVRHVKGPWRKEPMTDSFQKGWYKRVLEVIDKYCPDQLWFEIGFSDPGCIGENYVKSTLAHFFNTADKLGKEVVVTHKSDDLPSSCSVLDIEAGQLHKPQKNVWQTDIAIGTNNSWAYSRDAVCRPVKEIIDEIVDRKSKNGITLLDIAPKPDGTLPPSQVEGLKKLGKWMGVNKPALYGTTPAPFAKGGVDVAEAGSIRFTQKGNLLYAIDLEKPSVPLLIPGVKPIKGSGVRILGYDKNLAWHMEGSNLVIDELPTRLPCNYAWSFAIQVLD